MADKSEKPSKADKILEAMDDLSAAVDGFAARLQGIERLIDSFTDGMARLHDRLGDVVADLDGVRNTLNTMEQQTYDIDKEVKDIGTTVDTMNDRLEDVAKISENLEKNFPDFQEVADDIRRRERQDQLFEARAAMGKVKFISMRA